MKGKIRINLPDVRNVLVSVPIKSYWFLAYKIDDFSYRRKADTSPIKITATFSHFKNVGYQSSFSTAHAVPRSFWQPLQSTKSWFHFSANNLENSIHSASTKCSHQSEQRVDRSRHIPVSTKGLSGWKY
uniref:Uncharacterized protein n=1 Tax=Anguilla anguilla TaxID=7936 RepID=A0A0E9WFF6_ANGAN